LVTEAHHLLGDLQASKDAVQEKFNTGDRHLAQLRQAA